MIIDRDKFEESELQMNVYATVLFRWCGRRDGRNLAEEFISPNPDKRKYVENRDQLLSVDVEKAERVFGKPLTSLVFSAA